MLKKAGAVALSASMLFASNCAISTKAAEEKATVAAEKEISLQDRAVGFFKEHGLKLGIGLVTIVGATGLTVYSWYRFFRNHLQANINGLVDLVKKDKPSENDLKAKAKDVLDCAKWVVIASNNNKGDKNDVKADIEKLFGSIQADGVKTKAEAAKFLQAIAEVFGKLKDQKLDGSDKEEAYSVRKNRGIFKKKALFMQYRDADEVAAMFKKAVEELGNK